MMFPNCDNCAYTFQPEDGRTNLQVAEQYTVHIYD